MKKKIIALCLVVVLAATAIVGGTLAYFTDSEQATNTMVIGNVEINIEEHVKNAEGQYDPFVDDAFTLYPISHEKVGTWAPEYYNKVVRTFNTSSSKNDAYIRTIVLIEKNDVLTDEFVNEYACCVPGLHFGYDGSEGSGACIDGKTTHGSKAVQLTETVTVDDEEYWVVVFTARSENAIPYGEGLHTLNMVWMDKNITSEQISGWGTDGKVSILVYSQGIQSYGLTHAEAMEALGEVNQTLINELVKADVALENDYTNN